MSILPTNRTTRIVVGLAFLLGAAALFTGAVTLGSAVTTTVVGTIDLIVGLVLLVSGVRFEPPDHTVEGQ